LADRTNDLAYVASGRLSSVTDVLPLNGTPYGKTVQGNK